MSIHSKSHPLWGFLNLTLCVSAGLGAMLIYATKFDETELKTLAAMVAGGGIGPIIKATVLHLRPTPNE